MQLSSRILCFVTSLLHFQLAVHAQVRGIPGVDYPNYSSIPKTSFKCPDEQVTPGFYADFETRCQVFHYCYEHRRESFLCPEGTTFNDAIKSCDYWYSSECDSPQSPYESEDRKSKKSIYNDVPLVPAKVQNNNIFDKIAALYEPKKQLENYNYKEKESAETGEFFEDLTDNGNEHYETDASDSDSLFAQGILLNQVKENNQKGENIQDFVKYEHDAVEGDDVDIVFYDSSVKPLLYKNDNNQVDMSSIGFLSETETGRYRNQDTTAEGKELYGTYNSEEQTELFPTNYNQPVENNFSDLAPSDDLLIKRLSDNLEAPKKKRFRRKPTYVVLQTQELDEFSPESAGYGVEHNQPIKDVYVDKAHLYHSLQTETSISDKAEIENKLTDFVQMPDRKLRRNRKTIQTLTDDSDKPTDETIESVKKYQTTKDTYIDETIVYHSLYKESFLSDSTNAENKSDDVIKMSVKKPKRNRKTFEILVEEPDKVDSQTNGFTNEYQTSKTLYADKTTPDPFLHTEADSFILDTTKIEKKPADINMTAKEPIRNRKFGLRTDELNKTDTKITESTKSNKDSIMPANIMSPSFEIDPEPVIFVSENDTTISKTDTFIRAQSGSTQATLLMTSTAPNSITTLQTTENEPKEIDNVMENFSNVEESYISFHKLKNAEIDVITEGPHSHDIKPADDFEKVTQNKLNFIPHLLNMNSEVGDRAYSEQELSFDGIDLNIQDMTYSEHDMDLDDIENMNFKVKDIAYSEEVNPDDIANINSREDEVYSKQELNSDATIILNSEKEDTEYSEQGVSPYNIVNVNSEVEDLDYSENELNSEIEDMEYSEQGVYPDNIVNMNSEVEDLEYSENEMNQGEIYNKILKSDVQADQYDNQNNYGTLDNTFSEAYENNMFSQSVKSDYNNYVLISTLSPITTTESSTVNVLDEDNNEHILVHGNSDSFGDEQMSGVEFEHINDHNVNGIDSEHEDGKNFADEEIDSDMNADISDLFDEEEIRDSNSEKEFVPIYPPADDNKHQYESFDERDDSATPTKIKKGILLETKLQKEVENSDTLNSQVIENEEGALKELVLNKLDANPTHTEKATSFQTMLVEKPQNEEEKPIDSVFHSSSMPLPANIFEQGLYKQSLEQDKNPQFNRDNIYPVIFYKELDESTGKSKNGKSVVVNTLPNKKYRSLDSNFPLGDDNLENVDDLSSKYREPSLFSLLESSQAVKRLLPIDFFGLKSGSIFSPPVGKISKPIRVKKLVAFGKNLLAFKRAKLNDFKLLFDSLMKEI